MSYTSELAEWKRRSTICMAALNEVGIGATEIEPGVVRFDAETPISTLWRAFTLAAPGHGYDDFIMALTAQELRDAAIAAREELDR